MIYLAAECAEHEQRIRSSLGEYAAQVVPLQRATAKLAETARLLLVQQGTWQPRELRERFGHVPLVLFAAEDSARLALESLKQGADEYLLASDSEQEIRRRLIPWLSEEPTSISASVSSQELYARAKRVAPTSVSILIQGESGTGKEVLARYIHRHSGREAEAFVAVNCAAIPENMLEAILFGHEKGAFTGAADSRPGKFELAHNGTLLLDEISEMPVALQAKLLRVLQEREVERVGAARAKSVNVRVLATTNRNLKDSVANGEFREDLYYRLNVFPLRLIPLRERPEDISPLAQHFVQRHRQNCARRELPALSEATLKILGEHCWGGNVRELENAIQRGLVNCDGPLIEPDHLQLDMVMLDQVARTLNERRLQGEAQMIQQTLVEHNGHRKQAAAALGISERTLRYKLQKLREQGVDLA